MQEINYLRKIEAGTEQIFKSINSMCEEYGFKKKNVRTMFNYRKSNKIRKHNSFC